MPVQFWEFVSILTERSSLGNEGVEGHGNENNDIAQKVLDNIFAMECGVDCATFIGLSQCFSCSPSPI